MKGEGIHGLFRGVASPTLTVGLMSAVLFQSFEMSKVWLTKLQYTTMFEYNKSNNNNNNNNNKYIFYDENSYPVILCSGGIAGAISCLITSPTEYVKCIVQDQTEVGTATIRQEFREAYSLYKNFGIFNGIFRGLGITIARDIPGLSLYFGFYELISNTFDPTKQSTIVAFIGGFFAGLSSWVITYPIDVIKTHYQLKKLKYGEFTLFNAIRYHVKLQGFKTLYNGLSATVLVCLNLYKLIFFIIFVSFLIFFNIFE